MYNQITEEICCSVYLKIWNLIQQQVIENFYQMKSEIFGIKWNQSEQ